MSDDTCTFSYVALKDSQPKIATGIERSWLDLKIEFSRQGEGVSGAKYYKTISKQGPKIFAVKSDQTVWYHDDGKWHKYQTAKDIKYGTIQSENFNPKCGETFPSTTDDDDDDDEPHFSQQEETRS